MGFVLRFAAMFLKKLHNRTFPHRLSIVALAIWLGGLNCLLCCGQFFPAVAAETPSCLAADGQDQNHEVCVEEDCCAGSESGQPAQHSGCQDGECCILDAPSSDLPRTPETIHPQPAITPSNWLPIASEPAFSIPHSSNQLRLENRGDTYLRCCVFLI